ncbi:N-acylglucosamine 2-epimerase [bacterium BMS3Bbin10]|nr:N-acylglucosamine 2-epimerase [bacterium BMS3Bbin10]
MKHVLAAFFVLLLGLPGAFAASSGEGEVRKANRLLNAASPYLRQHAYNPIDWYSWGDEAFEKAKKENKPVFLSVGYSTCYWCHVMARESFVDEKIAEILNSNFVSIKVDRERRPDVDETYMLATQLITGAGGWPNTVFLTPDKKPFYAGTYFPPDAFRSLISQVAGFWLRDEVSLRRDAEKLAGRIDTIMTRRVEAAEISPQILKTAADTLLQDYDLVYGGFGDAPKFPQESLLLFLLRMAEKDGNAEALDAVSHTLESILDGGMQDHVGGGFHRYTVDAKWFVPHFEKMLYNQALMTRALVRTHRLNGAPRLAAAARRTLDYVLDDMTSPQGGFYSARDAGEPGEEGLFYLWTDAQIDEALDEKDAEFAKTAFSVTFEGNYESGSSILRFPNTPDKLAKKLGVNEDEFNARIGKIRAKLAKARAKREVPHRDEKVVTAWNGMMMVAFAEAAETFGEKRYEAAALKAGTFMWEKMRVDGALKRAFFEGRAALDGQQEDHAFGALGFIALYDLTGGKVWLERAETLIKEMVKNFRDEKAGDYYMTASLNTFGKAKARTDSGTPSGNAAALEAFAKLTRRAGDPEHRINGEALLAALSGLAVRSPQSNAYSLLAADIQLRGGAGPRQYMSKGLVDARASLDPSSGVVSVSIKVAKGWHINSNTPLEEFFIPTELSVVGAGDAEITYPPHKLVKLGFHDKELALFDGTVELKAKISKTPKGSLTAKLRVQTCSDEICLEPETADLRIPVHVSPAS